MELSSASREAAERRRKHHKRRRKHKHKHHKPAPKPVRTAAGPLLSPGARHLVRRFSAGLTPALAQQVNASGGARSWFLKQLTPASVPDPSGDQVDSWFANLDRTPEEIYQRQRQGTEGSWEVMADLSRWTVSRRLQSSRQLQEVMVDFWSNLLHVPLSNDDAAFARVDYDKTIRRYALTSFEDLLHHAITHPAMGISLSNNVSTKKAPNENLGRELLELHTVGFGSGYTEDDVKASAKILTGYRVDLWPAFKASYDTSIHWTGRVKVMGFSSDNVSPDGRGVTAAYLSYLARHPRTAARIARRLCVKFVRDDPSAHLVDTVAAAYRAHGTAIKPTLLAMVEHPDFAAATGKKLRTPQEDWQAMVRALGIRVAKPTTDGSFVNQMLWQYKGLGAAPYEWPAPNGYPEVNAAWSSAGRMLNSFSTHRNMTAHWWPTAQASLPALSTLLPRLPATLQTVIDVVSAKVIGQPPGPRVSQAISTALGRPLHHVLTAREADSYWTRITIVSTLFDSPLHMYR